MYLPFFLLSLKIATDCKLMALKDIFVSLKLILYPRRSHLAHAASHNRNESSFPQTEMQCGQKLLRNKQIFRARLMRIRTLLWGPPLVPEWTTISYIVHNDQEA